MYSPCELSVPTSSWSNRYSRSAKLSRHGPFVHMKLARHNCERAPASYCAAAAAATDSSDIFADCASVGNAGVRDVVHDGASVDLVATGEAVDRVAAVSVLVDHLPNLRVGRPS